MSGSIANSGGTPPNSTVDGLPTLPPQYSTGGDTGFFTRQTESVPTSVTVGPDGALYVGELTGIPYPEGYARVTRVGDTDATTGFDGETPSGVPQTYASGFSEVNGLSFDGQGNLYVLEYENANGIYDPNTPPGDLPPSRLIKVTPDGVRTVISGDELKLGNYVLADKTTGDVYVAINNAEADNGLVLRYHTDAETGQTTHKVVASGLDNPRGLSFGPDGNLYVLESGRGEPADSPNVAEAPVIPFIPGVVSERGGYTGSITKVELDADGGQERVFTGLASFREVSDVTGEDRVISIGPNGFAIAPDGTVFVASGGGLSPQTAEAVGPLADLLSGIVKVEGLFDGDPTDATLTPGFNSIQFAAQNGPDGSQTLFNTQSNLNDVTIGADGKVYTVDAARNVIYGLEQDGTTLDSVTVIEKRPPVLTPPQYAAVIEAGGNPAADYRVEISEQTTKGPNGLPDTPGRVAALAASDASQETDQGEAGGTEGTGNPDQTPPPPRGEDSVVGVNNAAGDAGVPGAVGPIDPTVPGPVDPTSEPVRADNPYAPYFAPFFGNYAPAPNDKPVLPAGEQGSYIVSNVYSFGDRLAEDGGDYGANAVAKAAGVTVPWTTAPYSSLGNFTDGLNWTDYLSQALGVADSDQDTNFAYLNATARALENSLDPLQSTTSLSNFAGQIDRFEQSYGRLSPTDLVTVTFGGNDLTLPSDVTPQEGIDQSVDAIVDGLERLQCLGGEHFLVTNLPDVSLAPIFSDPNFLEALGGDPGFDKLVAEFNVELGEAVKEFSQRTGADVTLLDVNKLFDGIKANPDAYGFINVEEPVLQNTPMPGTTPEYNPAIVGQDPAVQHATLFIDSFFHPTALGHSLIAETAWHAIA